MGSCTIILLGVVALYHDFQILSISMSSRWLSCKYDLCLRLGSRPWPIQMIIRGSYRLLVHIVDLL